MAAQAWLIGGIILWIVEFATPFFLFGLMGSAALGASAAAYFGASLTNQLLLFGGLSLLLTYLARPAVLRFTGDRTQAGATNIDAHIGKVVVVREVSHTSSLNGRVTLGDESWLVRSANGKRLEVGQPMVVSHVDGHTLCVIPPPPSSSRQGVLE